MIQLRSLEDADEGREIPDKFFSPADCPGIYCWGEVSWSEEVPNPGVAFDWGRCYSCGTLARRCSECDSVTALGNGLNACDGCGAAWYVYLGHDGDESAEWVPSEDPL